METGPAEILLDRPPAPDASARMRAPEPEQRHQKRGPARRAARPRQRQPTSRPATVKGLSPGFKIMQLGQMLPMYPDKK
jgi:hypothetical protein